MVHIFFDESGPTSGPAYRFRGAQGPVAWPTKDGAGLGPAGAWNFFWRLGFWPVSQTANDPVPQSGEVLVVTAAARPSSAVIEYLRRWHGSGNWIIGAGDPAAFADWLPRGAVWSESSNPANAVAYVLPHGVEIIAPPKWSIAVWPTTEVFRRAGQIATIGGERQTPSLALVVPYEGAPATVAAERFIYLNANPFAACQGWLQGQYDLGPWLGWRSRMFWLDEHVAALWRVLVAMIPPLRAASRPGVAALGATTIVLRHDVDSSRDATYLDIEIDRGLEANWAVLLDKNRRFWVDRLSTLPGIECCFHYNTYSRSRDKFASAMRRVARLLGRTELPIWDHKPAVAETTRRGFRRQLAQARAAGIGVATIHRHGPFQVYPEWIDSLADCFDAEPELLGGGSILRGTVLRWGGRSVDGISGTIVEHPGVGHPLWWPFKLAHAGHCGRLLRGWETTSAVESEPEMVAQMLDHRIPELPQRVLTFGYHPQHATHPTFRPGGSVVWFNEVLDMIRSRGYGVMNLSHVYKTLAPGSASISVRPELVHVGVG